MDDGPGRVLLEGDRIRPDDPAVPSPAIARRAVFKTSSRAGGRCPVIFARGCVRRRAGAGAGLVEHAARFAAGAAVVMADRVALLQGGDPGVDQLHQRFVLGLLGGRQGRFGEG